MAEYPEVYPGESIPVVTQRVSSTTEVVVEDIVAEKTNIMLPKSAVQEAKQSFRERSDDWFVFLDAVSRKTAYIPPGTYFHQISLL